MSPLWTADEIVAATGGTTSVAFEAHGVAFDSREVEAGHLFIAMKGEATDGHRFLDKAFAAGATGALVSESCAGPHVRVADTIAGLEALGRASRSRVQARIAGVTGSVGKTGCKEALANCLVRANAGPVHRSVKSYNNHTGVPLSLARMPREAAFGVFEMGMNHAGEIRALTAQVRPHVALVTTIAPAHIEHLGSLEAIADAKAEIFEGLEPGGTAIIPLEAPHSDRLIAAAQKHAGRIVTFGRSSEADVTVLETGQVADGTRLHVRLGKEELAFTLGLAGDHWIGNSLGVLAAVQALGGDLAAAGLALGDMQGLAGRGARHTITTPDNGSALLIDESYNANPASMQGTLAVLSATPGERRIAVLGEMRELGPTSDELHAKLAAPVIQAGVSLAILVGNAMKPLADALAGHIETVHVTDAAEAGKALEKTLRNGDVLLIKGSNAVGLGRIVTALSNGS